MAEQKPSDRILARLKKNRLAKRLRKIGKPISKSALELAKGISRIGAQARTSTRKKGLRKVTKRKIAGIKQRRIEANVNLRKRRRNILSKTIFAEKITKNLEEKRILPKPKVILDEKIKSIGRTRFI